MILMQLKDLKLEHFRRDDLQCLKCLCEKYFVYTSGISKNSLLHSLFEENFSNLVDIWASGLFIGLHLSGKKSFTVLMYLLCYIYSSSFGFQFSSVTQSFPTLCNPMNCSTPGLPVHHQLPEFTQTRVHRVSDAIQPSHPLSSPSPPAPNPSQHQSLFQ